MMTVRGRSLPTSVSGYRSELDGVKGFVVTIEGRSAFLPDAQAYEFGAYLQTTEPRPDTAEVTAPAQRTGGWSLHGLVAGS